MATRLFHVDAFTDVVFAGNPAAVCVLDEGASPSDEWMLGVAAEMNLSETAFVRFAARDGADGDDDGWSLRWFTPKVEVDLCGHATLAAAHVLWSEGIAAADPLCFATRSGHLTAARAGGVIELDFPVLESVAANPPPGLRNALGVEPIAVLRNVHDLLVEVADEVTVRALAPDLEAIAAIDVRAVVVTALSDDPQFDFVSRCFGPRVGINEDPVTGSAHCALAPYWGEKLGKTEMRAYQASARGGSIHVRIEGDRVVLGGTAVTVARGQLVA
jgi:predicted PhzF superfamily epimerase YddE/YHI9